MRILPDPIAFQWDSGNIDKNFSRHSVTTQEAEELFSSQPFMTVEDAKHSITEMRFHGLGETKVGRQLFVAFTMRGALIGVISIRYETKERTAYEQFKTNS